MKHTQNLHPMTLADACAEATKRGFVYIAPPMLGITQRIDEFIEELDSPDAEKEYAIYGTLLIRLTDAWREDAEVYELSC